MTYPAKAFKHYRTPAFALRAGTAAIDAGRPLTGLGLPTGSAPDLGAIQLGQKPVPVGAP